MRRYLFTFRKNGYMRFISHLDMQRLFRRSFRRAEVEPEYTKGFNPRPRINIVLPLSLGFETDRDYLEMDTANDYECEDLLKRMNAVLPEGVEFTACKEIEAASKNLSSKVEFSEYEVKIPGKAAENAKRLAKDFLSDDEIFVMKRDKKTKSLVKRSAKGMVEEFSVIPSGTDEIAENEEGATFRLILRTAANSSLNPKDFMSSFCGKFEIDSAPEQWQIVRKDMYIRDSGDFIPLFDL